MRFIKWAWVFSALLCVSADLSANDRVTVIRAGAVITGTGETISPGEVVIEDGKISLVGSQLEIPENAKIINAPNQTLMPGMVLSKTSQGLIGSRVSGIGCDQTVLNRWVDSEMDWDSFLEAGFVAAAFVPAGTGFHGQAIVVHTASEAENRILRESVYLPLTVTGSTSLHRTIAQAFDGARKEIEKVKKARESWEKEQEEAKKKAEEAKKKAAEKGEKEQAAEAKGDKSKEGEGPKEFKAPPMNPALIPIVDILEEKSSAMPMVVSISTPGSMLHLDSALSKVKELEERDPQSIFVLPASRNGAFHEVVDLLIERKATVMIPPGMSAFPDTYYRFHVPAALSRGGCEVITLPRSDNASGLRGIPGLLSEQIRYGMSKDDAIASVTSAPAKFLGLGDRMGTIEEGKDAHLILLNGSLLDPGVQVMKTMISGEVVWDREER
ncbi:hypothetical protein CBD41_03885 [bacterium TMED181]|nr:hypothetical protein [Planctomycetota bacterium]OUW45517.1 MAG: hypothetical protein CBD41_03885 [bacterium TMED181]